MILKMYARYKDTEPKWQTLLAHLNDVALLAGLHGANFNCMAIAQIAALLHDIGKSTDSWQKYLRDSIEGKTRCKKDHSTAGAQIFREKYSEKKLLATAIEAVVMYHHGSGLPDFISPDGTSEFLERLNKSETETELSEVEKKIPIEIYSKVEKRLQSPECQNDARAALLEPCKRGLELHKNIADKKRHLFFNMGLHLRNLSSCLIDADRSDSAAFERGEKIDLKPTKIPDWTILLQKLERHLTQFSNEGKLSEIRKNLSERCSDFGDKEKGVYTCSAFTGSGKTLASLRFALKQAAKFDMKHIFIVAPYTSILDQNAEVIRNILEDKNTRGEIVLECHSNLTTEKKADLKESEENYSHFEETWDSPVIVTTMVQFLEMLFGSGTRSIRRMHQIANSVLVFDEIQTLPIKTTYLFNWGLEYLVNVCDCSAMLCTATQPCLDKIGDEAYHLNIDDEVVENVNEHFDSLQRVDFLDMTNGGRKKHSAEEIADYIENEMNFCKSFLAVVNTKPQAKELFELVKHKNCTDFVYHLSTDMCPTHRKSVIADIKGNLENGRRVICISTRLIEAGVDLSFEGSLRYLAGLDSIIQTAGRCNRNNELRDENGNVLHGKLAIFSAENEKLGSLEELKIGRDCMERILREFPADKKSKICCLIRPEVIEAYFNYYYASFKQDILEYKVKDSLASVLDMLSDNKNAVAEYERVNGKKWTLPYCQSFKTAWEHFEVISDATTGIIVSYKEGADIIGELSALEKSDSDYYEKLRTLLKRAQQFSVNVYSNQLLRLGKENMIFEVIKDSGIYALREDFYTKNLGIVYNIENSEESSFSVLSF